MLHCWGDINLSTTKIKVLEGILTKYKLIKNTLTKMGTYVPSLTTLGHFFYIEEIWIEIPSFKGASLVEKA